MQDQQQTNTQHNRRRFNRQATQQVEVISARANFEHSQQVLLDVSLHDLAQGGLGIECKDYLTPGDILDLQLSAGEGKPFTVSATICHRSSLPGDGGFRYGLYFNQQPHERQKDAPGDLQSLLETD